MSSTTITTHGVTKIRATFQAGYEGRGPSDFMRLTIVDRKGDEIEIDLYAQADVNTFEAIAYTINAAQATVDQVEGME